MGKTLLILLAGFAASFGILAQSKNQRLMESVDRMVDQYAGYNAQNAAASGVYMALNRLYRDPSWRAGYGNLVIIRHSGGFSTVYANNQVNLVRQSQRVRAGDIIARVGQGTHATGASLHFEVRRDNVARNPLPYLPANTQVSARHNGRDG